MEEGGGWGLLFAGSGILASTEHESLLLIDGTSDVDMSNPIRFLTTTVQQ